MKKVIISTALILIIGGVFSYRYYFAPKRIETNFTSKLVLKKDFDKIDDRNESVNSIKKTVEKSDADKNVPIVNNEKKPVPEKKTNILKNGRFDDGMNGWHLWQTARKTPENIKIIDIENNYNFSSAVEIVNPNKKLLGISQVATLTSGTVYRLSGTVRSLGNDKSKIFGGRIAIYLPPQPERQLIWMSEYNKFWKKELVFTNQVTGQATVYVHLGYGGVATTGEFADVRLEEIIQK